MTTTSQSSTSTLTLDFGEQEAWSVQTLLTIVREIARRHGISTLKAECSVHVQVEATGGQSDFEAFRRALNDRFIAFDTMRGEQG